MPQGHQGLAQIGPSVALVSSTSSSNPTPVPYFPFMSACLQLPWPRSLSCPRWTCHRWCFLCVMAFRGPSLSLRCSRPARPAVQVRPEQHWSCVIWHQGLLQICLVTQGSLVEHLGSSVQLAQVPPLVTACSLAAGAVGISFPISSSSPVSRKMLNPCWFPDFFPCTSPLLH